MAGRPGRCRARVPIQPLGVLRPGSLMAFGEERCDGLRLFLGHRPEPVGVACHRVAEQARSLPVARELVRDLVRDEVRLRHENSERLFGLLPSVESPDPARVRDGDHDLDGHVAGASSIRAGCDFRDRSHSDGLFSEQFEPVSLKVRPEELPLALRLVNG